MGHYADVDFNVSAALSPDGSLLAVQAKGQPRVYHRDGSLLWQAGIGHATGPALPAVRSANVVRVLAWRDDTAYAVVTSASRNAGGMGSPRG
jgi:hypothetical protein